MDFNGTGYAEYIGVLKAAFYAGVTIAIRDLQPCGNWVKKVESRLTEMHEELRVTAMNHVLSNEEAARIKARNERNSS
jgi:hypothetical protein